MNFEPIPLSVANAKLLQEWQGHIQQYIADHARTRIMESVTAMYNEDPSFAEVVNKAIENGGNYEDVDIQQWAKSNIDKAMKFRQSLHTLPHTMSALNLGIDCIKATADRAKLSEQDAKDFDNKDFWLHVSMTDVQKYCNKILDMK
jgi:hypothetical protein